MKKNINYLGIMSLLIVGVLSSFLRGEITINNSLLGNAERYFTAASPVAKESFSKVNSKVEEVTYTKYLNPRFGFKIEYPSFLTNKRESENGDGIVLQNSEQNAVLIIAGINNDHNQTPEAIFNSYVKNTKDIVYKKLVGNTFMISAENAGTVYYIFENVGAGSINSFVLGYPKEEGEKFQEVIKHLKKTFESPYIHESR